MTLYLRARFQRLNDLFACRSGNFALFAAIVAPLLVGLAGAAVDFSSLMAHRSNLQDIADAAALSSAKEAALNGWSANAATAIVEGFLEAHKNTGFNGIVKSKVEVNAGLREVKVMLAEDNNPYFVAGYFVGSPQIVVSSTARTNNSSNICVIGLEKSDESTVSLQTNAVISAPKCAVYSNSDSTNGLTATGNSNLVAQLTCSAGGYSGMPKNYNQKLPLTDCPVVTDPLASRPAPTVGGCNEKDASYSHYIGSLQPGVYCGGLTIKASSEVTLKPGVYVIKDGPLVIESNSVVDAKGVGFYFTGANASFLFESSSQVDIEAPISGPLAGLVAFQDRDSPEADFVITSNRARKLIGTIYLPNGNLIVAANNKVADGSAYTAIVVRRLHLSKAPNLVLNTNYDATMVPVPEGVGPEEIAPRLIN